MDKITAFYSCLFLVKKATGGWRPAINLLPLNKFVVLTSEVRMETVVLVLVSVRKGDFMFSVDLKDACFQISNHPESCPFLHLVVDGKFYLFKYLCFGLSAASQVFT